MTIDEYEYEMRVLEAKHLVETDNHQKKIRLIQIEIENVNKDYEKRKEILLKRFNNDTTDLEKKDTKYKVRIV